MQMLLFETLEEFSARDNWSEFEAPQNTNQWKLSEIFNDLPGEKVLSIEIHDTHASQIPSEKCFHCSDIAQKRKYKVSLLNDEKFARLWKYKYIKFLPLTLCLQIKYEFWEHYFMNINRLFFSSRVDAQCVS